MSEKIVAKFMVGKFIIYLIKNHNYYLKITTLKSNTIATIQITSHDNLKELLKDITGFKLNISLPDLK